MPQLDPKIINLAKAIRKTESNDNFTARSKDGSFGAYQFLKPTWDQAAKKFGVNAQWEKATPQQQNEVAYKQLEEWSKKHPDWNVGNFASAWNAGAGKPNAYLTGKSGVNSSGVAYNVANYAKKVATTYQQLKGQAPQNTQATEEQPVVEPKKTLGQKILNTATDVANFLGFKGVQEQYGATIAKAQATPEEKPFVEFPTQKEVIGSAIQGAANFIPGAGKGLGLLGKAAVGGATGYAIDVGSKLQDKEKTVGQAFIPGTATIIGSALPIVGKGLQLATQNVPKLLSYTSDVPTGAFDMLKQRESLIAPKIGKVTAESVRDTAQVAVRSLRTQLTNDWQESVPKIVDEFQGKRVSFGGNLKKTLEKVSDEFNVELPQNLSNVSVNEAIKLIKDINSLPKLMLSVSPKGAIVRKLKPQLTDKIIQTFGGPQGPVATLWKNYAAKSRVFDAANSLLSAYKLDKPLSQATVLGRLKTLFNENKSAYLDAIIDLEKATGLDVLSDITALQFDNILPKKSLSSGSVGGSVDKLLKLMVLPLTSPRGAAWIARNLKGPKIAQPIQTGARKLLQQTVAQ